MEDTGGAQRSCARMEGGAAELRKDIGYRGSAAELRKDGGWRSGAAQGSGIGERDGVAQG